MANSEEAAPSPEPRCPNCGRRLGWGTTWRVVREGGMVRATQYEGRGEPLTPELCGVCAQNLQPAIEAELEVSFGRGRFVTCRFRAEGGRLAGHGEHLDKICFPDRGTETTVRPHELWFGRVVKDTCPGQSRKGALIVASLVNLSERIREAKTQRLCERYPQGCPQCGGTLEVLHALQMGAGLAWHPFFDVTVARCRDCGWWVGPTGGLKGQRNPPTEVFYTPERLRKVGEIPGKEVVE